jgi:tetratricopeptide (TPR) repeat protein
MKTLFWLAIAIVMGFPPRLTVVPEAGSTVSDIVEIRVTSSEPLKRVDFLLDGNLVGSDTSTPYTWTWDTLSVSEGEHVLTLRVLDMNDRTMSTEVRYVVDNGLSRGGAFYLEASRQHVAEGRWDDALKAARRAVRLLPNDGQAHYLLARAWLGLSQWTKAVESAEQAVKLSPSPETFETLAQAHVRLAFAQTVDQEKRFASLQSAIETARRGGELLLSQAKTAQEKAHALARLGRLEEAATTYLQAGSNRQNFLSAARCYLLAGRWRDAERMCNLAERQAEDKTVVSIYRALIKAARARTTEARNVLESLQGTDEAATLLALARAEIALREMKASDALRILVPLHSQGRAPEWVDTLLMTAFAETRDFPRAEDHFRDALLRNPLNWLALAQKGYETLAVGSIATASRYFELAASIRPDDAWVLCGQSLCTQDKRLAVELAQKAVRQSADDPWAVVVLSCAQSRAGQIEEAFRSIERARSMDRDNYNMGVPPDVRRAGQIARIRGRRPVLPLEQ